jgi:hypothetical protein
MRPGLAALLAAVLLGFVTTPAVAHDGATIKAVVEIGRGGESAVYVVVDRQHLPADFGTSAPAVEVAGAPADAAVLRETRGVVAGLALLFDGAAAPLRAAWVAPRRPADLQIRLVGTTPSGARSVALRNDLHVGAWMVSVRHEGRGDDTAMVLGDGEAMPPVAIDAAFVPRAPTAVAAEFVKQGFLHILPGGLDHILFVLGLFLIATRAKPLLLQVTAFTVAHTATLALSACGVVTLPGSVVEPLIAVSIVYVAVENIVSRDVGAARMAVVFAFGLLHGLGFAGALADLGLPSGSKALALVSFNVGVELGQLAVLAAACLALALPLRGKPWYRARVVVPGSVAIAALGAFWAVTRFLGK